MTGPPPPSAEPSISVALSTFNGARFLEAQLDSLARQTRPPLELQVGDDGSTDATIPILESFRERAPFPVHLHRNPRNLGFGESFIQTARRCSGEWIAFCDQDDLWRPEKLETCAQGIAAAGPDLSLVAHNVTVTDAALGPLRTMYDYPERKLLAPQALPPDWHCMGFTQIVRGALLRGVPAAPRPSVPGHPWKESHDVWAAILANATGSILLLGTPLALYRRHGDTVTDPQAPPGAGARLGATLRNNADAYRTRAGYLRSIAAILRTNAEGAPDAIAVRMRSAAARAEAFAAQNERRARLYESPSSLGALGQFFGLTAAGAYAGGKTWPFGPKAFLKDFAAALLPPLRKPR